MFLIKVDKLKETRRPRSVGVLCSDACHGSNWEAKLISDLMRDYNRHARPTINVSKPVETTIAFCLTKILGLVSSSVLSNELKIGYRFGHRKYVCQARRPSHSRRGMLWGSSSNLFLAPAQKNQTLFNSYHFTICMVTRNSCPYPICHPQQSPLPLKIVAGCVPAVYAIRHWSMMFGYQIPWTK